MLVPSVDLAAKMGTAELGQHSMEKSLNDSRFNDVTI